MHSIKKHKKTIIFSLPWVVFFAVLVLFMPRHGHPGDMGHWERWAAFMLQEGFANIYDYGLVYPTIFGCNYPPVLLYFLFAFGKIIWTVEGITANIHCFKAVPLLFDFIGAFSIFYLVKKEAKTQLLLLPLILNLLTSIKSHPLYTLL